ncbi:unnamed protein product [Schistosoma curassoni]|uniref:Uncharacterized protein n=1 Tax=Schistosoma curassoni TaxID=6186 RepID=A0A183KTM8_9TREM|nr:unnamed protein product [Schistosoma curassoni]
MLFSILWYGVVCLVCISTKPCMFETYDSYSGG